MKEIIILLALFSSTSSYACTHGLDGWIDCPSRPSALNESQNGTPASCEEETGLPECGTVAPRIHCCENSSSIPNVQCFRPYVVEQDSAGNWYCQYAPTLWGH